MHRTKSLGTAFSSRTRQANLALCLLLILIYWLWLFWPAVAHHQNLMGYHLLAPEIVGSERVPTPSGRNFIPRWPTGDWSLHLVHVPYQAFLGREFRQGTFPLWNPEIGCGQPVTSDPQYKPFNPFFAPFFVAPSAWMFSMGMALMALAGMIGYSLFFAEMGFGTIPTVFFGVLAAWNPLTQQTITLSSSWAIWMLGWGFWGARLWSQNVRSGPFITTAAGALTLFCGHPGTAMMACALLGAYICSVWEGPPKKIAWALVLFLGGVAALTAVHTFPFLAESSRYWSYKNNWDGGPFLNWAMFADPTSVLYIPMPLWGLAFMGLFLDRSRVKWFFLSAMAYGILLMFPLIESGPLRWLLSLGGTLVARYGGEPFWLGLAGIMALGVRQAVDADGNTSRWLLLRFFAYGTGGYYLTAWLVMTRHFTFYWPGIYRHLHRFELVVCGLVAAALILNGLRHLGPLSRYGLLSLLLVPPMAPSSIDQLWSLQDFVVTPPAIVRPILEGQASNNVARISGEYHVQGGVGVASLPPNQVLYWGLSDIRLCSPVALRNFADFSDAWQVPALDIGGQRYLPRQDRALLEFLGVRWFLRKSTAPPNDERPHGPLVLEPLSDSPSWVRGVRAWEVESHHNLALAKTYKMLKSETWRETAIVDRPPSIQAAPPSEWQAPQTTWLKDGPNDWAWEVSAKAPGLLLILQNSHPGWHALLDGQAIRPLTAYGTFLAIPYEAGAHRVELTFHEPWFFVGLWVSLAAWVYLAAALIVYFFKAWRARRNGCAEPASQTTGQEGGPKQP